MSKGNPSVHGGWPDKQEMASLYYKYYSAKKMNKFPVQVVTRMKMLHKAKEARHKGTGRQKGGAGREAVAVQSPAVPAADFARPCQGPHGMLSDNDEP